ncbi:hypothetical protein DFP72DRAFT_868146 [Ephemerocybe angulata]|uniref:Uncharacterized protein n=1 Tax=Ephemerocybe angulata TaxID=980116 RepID=A0A8H6IH60_9AGAR|nr:hypothetical protein DFP72DRAFT_868146 [Tulosesus angulatus]
MYRCSILVPLFCFVLHASCFVIIFRSGSKRGELLSHTPSYERSPVHLVRRATDYFVSLPPTPTCFYQLIRSPSSVLPPTVKRRTG